MVCTANCTIMKSVSGLRVCSRHKELFLTILRNISTSKRVLNGERVRPPLLLPPSSSTVNISPGSHSVLESESTPSGGELITARAAQQSNLTPSPLQPDKNTPGDSVTEDFSTTRPIAYDVRRVDPDTVKQIFFFDTLGMVKALQNNGYSRQQAEGMAECLVEVINTTLEHQSRHMVTKTQQEITVQQLMSEIASVKKDMVILQKSEFSSLRNETEKQTFEIRQIKDSLRDEISKLKGQMTLDINLERSRAVEAHAENSKNLLQLNQKIETEVAHLRTIYEQYRNDVFKYAGGTVLTCAGLCLGIMRLWS